MELAQTSKAAGLSRGQALRGVEQNDGLRPGSGGLRSELRRALPALPGTLPSVLFVVVFGSSFQVLLLATASKLAGQRRAWTVL